ESQGQTGQNLSHTQFYIFKFYESVREDSVRCIFTIFHFREELDIDLTDIYYKIRCILLPLPYFRMKLNIVRESPDFWGPLLVVLAYALLSIYGQFSVVSWILTMWFCGGFIVYFIARALGGDVGYSQVSISRGY
ncbi:hypothetical protein Angca_007170, partial [Angiostrongylus cantonensis]